MDVRIDESWKRELSTEFTQPYFKALIQYVKMAYSCRTVYPAAKNIFRAFALSSFIDTKVIILGQDPYPGPGQADGLAFSVPPGIPFPPSLRNIFTEIQFDLGIPRPTSGSLDGWARQGVLLLNATLTVESYQAGSHQKQGWELFTDAVVQTLARNKSHLVFMLWGSYAQQKGRFIDNQKHLVLKSAHPSPLSAHRGFFHNRHFSQANSYLLDRGQTPIQWASVG